jgi:hypothetical protein
MIDKGIQKVLTLFYFFVKKYKNIAWAPCGGNTVFPVVVLVFDDFSKGILNSHLF